MKRVISFVLIAACILSVVPALSFEAQALYQWIYDRNSVDGSDYTTSAALAEKLNSIFDGNASVYSNSGCTNRINTKLGSYTVPNNGVTQYVGPYGGSAINSGTSCWIYANGVYYTLFGECTGNGTAGSNSVKLSLSGTSDKKGSYNNFKTWGVRQGVGALIRANGHSMIVLGYDEDSLTILEGNGNNDGRISIRVRSWDQISFTVSYIIQPKDSYYNSLYSEHADTPRIKWWLSDTVYGSEVSEYKAGNRYYFCYQLYDPLTGKLWDEVTNDNYTFTMTMYHTDGTILNSQTYSDDESYISVFYTEAGTYEYSLVMDGDWTFSSTRTFTVQENPLQVYCVPYSISLTLGENESQTVEVWTTGYYDGNWTLYWAKNNNVVSCTWEPASNGISPLIISANSVGSCVVTVSARDIDTGEILDSWDVYVTVSESTYTVTFNCGNGATFSTPSITVSQGNSIFIPTEVPQKFGQNFIEWQEGIYTTGDSLYPGDTFTPSSNVTLYAHWQVAEQVYPISTPNVNIQYANSGIYYKFIPSRSTSYRFTGLDVNGDGGRDSVIRLYDANGNQLATDDDSGKGNMFELNYDMVAGQTYYIYVYLWGGNTGTFDFGVEEGCWVQYNANGGTGAPEGFYHYVGSGGSTISNTVPTREGYTFLGWSTGSTATTATYSAGSTINVGADTVLYAVWKTTPDVLIANSTNSAVISTGDEMRFYDFTPATSGKYVIYSTGTDDTKVFLFDVNGNELATNDDGGENNNFRLERNLIAGTTYTFGVRYYGSTVTGTISFNFGNVYSISFNANGGNSAPATQYKDYGTALTLSSTVPTRTGYTFLGWATSSTATSATYSAGGSFTTDATTTLYAVWKANIYTVNYNANGGSGAPGSQTKTHGQALTLSSTVPTRTGYTFLGWATSSTATTATYQPGDSFTTNSNTILYAVWKNGCESWAHSYSYTATKAPTESATGTLTGTCSKCSATTTVTLPKLTTADYTYSVTKAATCTAAGTGRYTWKTTTYGSFYFDVAISATGHSYTSKVTASTCTEQGYTTHTCSACGSSYKDSYTAALGHSYSYTATKAPTESATGTLTGTCSKCSATTTVTLPKLTTADYTYGVTQAATCTAAGTGRYTWKTTTYGSFYFDVAISATGIHSWSAWNTIAEPTCTAEGKEERSCSVCGGVQQQVLGVREHEYEGKTLPATCTAPEKLCYTCRNCGDTYEEIVNTQLGEHTWNAGVVTTEPTCGQTGIKTYTCTVCSATKTETLQSLAHDYHNGVCSRCDAQDPNYCVFEVSQWNIALKDSIEVKFYLNVSQSIAGTAKVRTTIGNETATCNISALEKTADGYYVLKAKVAAAQMNDFILVMLINGSKIESTNTYTVRQYCDTILADSTHSQYHSLVKEMLNYGAMAQKYFDYDAENLANTGITGTAANAVPDSAQELKLADNIDGLDFYGASLVHRDRIAVRYYFTGDITGMIFTANGNVYTPIAKDGMYYVEITDILPQDLDQQITLTAVNIQGGTLSVTYGPMNYIIRMNEKGSAELKALVKALYNYHLAAKAVQETV